MRVLRLAALSMISIARQPVVGVLLLVPAVLVIVAADGLNRFGEVVGMGAGHGGGAGHADHFVVLTTIWASGITAAVIAGVTLTESAKADARVAALGGGRAWLGARLLSFAGIVVAATTVSVGLGVARGAAIGLEVWGWALAVAALYVLVGVIGSRISADPVVIVGVVSAVWVADALTSPSMGSDAPWKAVVSPFYAAERASMGMGSPVEAIAVTLGWALALGGVGLVAERVRVPRWRRPSHRSRSAAHAPREVARVPVIKGSVVRLLVADLLRHRGLVIFCVAGPLGLMLSSLWLFQGVEVIVPVVTNGQASFLVTTMPELHATYMGLIAVVSFGGTAGYLIGADLNGPDRRLAHASGRAALVRLTRIGSLVVASLMVTASALGPIVVVRHPQQWGWFVAAHCAAALTFTVLGYGAGLVLDRVTGLMLMMLFPFVDVGIAQDYMLGPVLPDWGAFLPARPFAELVIGSGFGEVADPLRSGLWAVVVLLAACGTAAALGVRGPGRS